MMVGACGVEHIYRVDTWEGFPVLMWLVDPCFDAIPNCIPLDLEYFGGWTFFLSFGRFQYVWAFCSCVPHGLAMSLGWWERIYLGATIGCVSLCVMPA